MLYFHGNAVDLGNTYQYMSQLRDIFGLRIIAMEYRGYGIYREEKSSEALLMDAVVMDDMPADHKGTFKGKPVVVQWDPERELDVEGGDYSSIDNEALTAALLNAESDASGMLYQNIEKKHI